MATTYRLRELYGGAITVELPTDLIDSSDIRQIPDHQEVFLSRETLTSIIIEINNYVEAPDPITTETTTTTTASGITTTSTTTTVFSEADLPPEQRLQHSSEHDLAAAAYHFTDVISPPDRLASPLPLAEKVSMASPSLAQFPAYVLPGTIVSYEPVRRGPPPQGQIQQQQQQQQQQLAPPQPAGAPNGASNPPTNPASSLEHVQQLLVRMQPYETDLCVRINTPLKEFTAATDQNGDSSQRLRHEEQFTAEILRRFIATLDVKEFSLFAV
ncbi:hypothetical protein LTR84_011552 [Exophiala bonariae]|uniref:Uncharacterized protein n=1 Tax=Exophiala bonariae TaxID=1690606 RepID=A0AAV9NGT3_9EURO|nr:hypothetical protein LTR84_011552 [Exophiala bonariae]